MWSSGRHTDAGNGRWTSAYRCARRQGRGGAQRSAPARLRQHHEAREARPRARRAMRVPRPRRHPAKPPSKPPIVRIASATFYRHHPAAVPPPSTPGGLGHHGAANPPLFPNCSFTLQSRPVYYAPELWAVLSASSAAATAFFEVLRGQHHCAPQGARSYPFLSHPDIVKRHGRALDPLTAIKYVGFDAQRGGLGGSATRGAYLSQRYESHREVDDFSVRAYLDGHTQLNMDERLWAREKPPERLLARVVDQLRLRDLLDMPVSSLSNGQTRRARIAKALLGEPELLLIDAPFMGLDPPTAEELSGLLYNMAFAREPRVLLSARTPDQVPEWVTHLVQLDADYRVVLQGSRYRTLAKILNSHLVKGTKGLSHKKRMFEKVLQEGADAESLGLKYCMKSDDEATDDVAPDRVVSKDGFPERDQRRPTLGDPVVEMEGVKVQYGDQTALGGWNQPVEGSPEPKQGLWWTVRRGQRWGIFGPNGSGKTTLLSLLTSDHPQSYSAPMRLFQQSRLPKPGAPGLSYFDIQKLTGHSSPEVHTYFPRQLTVRQTVESAWADTPLSKPALDYAADLKVEACLRWFDPELNPSYAPSAVRELTQFPSASASLRAVQATKIRRALEAEAADPARLDWADALRFADLPFAAQRVALFLRAVVRHPDLLVLDEAFSGMDPAARNKCLLFLAHGERRTVRSEMVDAGEGEGAGERGGRERGLVVAESFVSRFGLAKMEGLLDRQALLVVSHNMVEVPGCVREWLCLPEPGKGAPRFGRLHGALELDPSGWRTIWGMNASLVLAIASSLAAADNGACEHNTLYCGKTLVDTYDWTYEEIRDQSGARTIAWNPNVIRETLYRCDETTKALGGGLDPMYPCTDCVDKGGGDWCA
ncbi:hypothetical protein BDY21DRAFT_362397 [Lineolata rhizophorae]|uniref:ABC transporter domain-containing protein n=1 Tax=Lineolata rhizophorae TaxID=578093 RepID=A0A6A6P4P4_9PEZI|nr:hypothetical protein BDY21DRAFT_362397 [Lineolata rhizophorae]